MKRYIWGKTLLKICLEFKIVEVVESKPPLKILYVSYVYVPSVFVDSDGVDILVSVINFFFFSLNL